VRSPKGTSPDVLEDIHIGAYRYVLKSQKCNKKACGKCPHGPYWYLYIKLAGGREVKRYLGKAIPEPVANRRPKETK
jgi:hypothetical protein